MTTKVTIAVVCDGGCAPVSTVALGISNAHNALEFWLEDIPDGWIKIPTTKGTIKWLRTMGWADVDLENRKYIHLCQACIKRFAKDNPLAG